MPKAKPELWEVVDSYGVVCYTGTLANCGVWIDPILGINFGNGEGDWPAEDDADRVFLQDDGSYVVTMYHTGFNDGIGGELTVRKKSA